MSVQVYYFLTGTFMLGILHCILFERFHEYLKCICNYIVLLVCYLRINDM